MRIKAGLGSSSAADAAAAGREAACAAIANLKGAEPALVIVYSALRYDPPQLLRAVGAVTGNTPLIGATSSGYFAGGEFSPPGEGVAVMALSAGEYRFGIATAEHIHRNMQGVGQQLARDSRAAAGGGADGAVLLLGDGLVHDMCDHQQLIQGIYRVGGMRIPVVGGVASDEFTMSGTAVFHGQDVLTKGAVAVWIASPRPLKVVTGHGWTPVGRPMLVSVSHGTQIVEIDGKSAFDAYCEQLNSIGVDVDQQSRFWDTGYRHPLGLLQPNGSVLIRVPEHKVDDGSLWTHSPIPAGCAVQVMTGSTDGLLEHAGEVAREAIEAQPTAGAVLAFSCAARLAVCGPRIAEEAASIQAAAGKVPTFGFYTYGEFARGVGALGVHNATVTALAL
jgi:hypothetical protein